MGPDMKPMLEADLEPGKGSYYVEGEYLQFLTPFIQFYPIGGREKKKPLS